MSWARASAPMTEVRQLVHGIKWAVVNVYHIASCYGCSSRGQCNVVIGIVISPMLLRAKNICISYMC